MTDAKSDSTHGERRKAMILACGVKLWRNDPASVSARRIAGMMKMTHGAVLHYFDNAAAMHRAIADEAVRTGDPVIVPMLIASRHPAADALSATDRRRFLAGC